MLKIIFDLTVNVAMNDRLEIWMVSNELQNHSKMVFIQNSWYHRKETLLWVLIMKLGRFGNFVNYFSKSFTRSIACFLMVQLFPWIAFSDYFSLLWGSNRSLKKNHACLFLFISHICVCKAGPTWKVAPFCLIQPQRRG